MCRILQLLKVGFFCCLPWHDAVTSTPWFSLGRRRARSPGWALLCQCCSCLGAVTDASCKKQPLSHWSLHPHTEFAAGEQPALRHKSRSFGQGAARVRWAGGVLGWHSQDLDVKEPFLDFPSYLCFCILAYLTILMMLTVLCLVL